MTTPFDGANAPKREPAPKKRRNTRRPGSKRNDNQGAEGSEKIAKGPESRAQSPNGQGSVITSNAAGVSVASGENPGSPGKSRRRRRRRGRKGGGNANHQNQSQELRNVRAPVVPTPDVSFSQGEKPETARHSKKQRGQGKKPAYASRPRSLYAALDLGTNNCRLLIATPQERGRFRVVDAFSRIVRLGEGLGHSGALTQGAMDRSLEALKICAGKLKAHNIRGQRLIATEACRQAENGEAFIQRVVDETGLELEIVNRETEARLAAEGCGSLLDKKAEGAVLFDIGGGSSELILVNGAGNATRKRNKGGANRSGAISERIAAWTSLPLGVVTLSERFGGGSEVTRTQFDDMVSEVIRHIDAFEHKDRLAKVWKDGRVHLLGTSGTVTTIAGVHLELPRYDRRKVDGVWLTDSQIDTVISNLLDMNFSERAQNPCIGHDRADLVLAGCAILQAIRQTWPTTHLRVADRGLREGLLTEMISADGAWLPYRRKNRFSKHRGRNQQHPAQAGNVRKDG